MSTQDGTSATHADPRVVVEAAVAAVEVDPSFAPLPGDLQRICRAVPAVLPLTGAVIHVLTGAGPGSVVAASDEASRLVGEAVFSTGEGPSLEAFALSRPVLVPDLMGTGQSRWPGFVSAVRASGVRACFSLPLHVGAARLGVLDLYGANPNGLSAEQTSLALVFAELATERLLQRSVDVPEHALDGRLLGAMQGRSEIHQAQGMVMVDLGVDLAEALALLRASAFRRDLTLIDVAREVLDGARLTSIPEV